MDVHIRKLPGSNIEQEFYLVTEVDVTMAEVDKTQYDYRTELNQRYEEQITELKAKGITIGELVTENAMLKKERDALLLHPADPDSLWQGINKEAKLWEGRALKAKAEEQVATLKAENEDLRKRIEDEAAKIFRCENQRQAEEIAARKADAENWRLACQEGTDAHRRNCEEVEQWKRVIVAHVEEIARLRDALDDVAQHQTGDYDDSSEMQKIAQDALKSEPEVQSFTELTLKELEAMK